MKTHLPFEDQFATDFPTESVHGVSFINIQKGIEYFLNPEMRSSLQSLYPSVRNSYPCRNKITGDKSFRPVVRIVNTAETIEDLCKHLADKYSEYHEFGPIAALNKGYAHCLDDGRYYGGILIAYSQIEATALDYLDHENNFYNIRLVHKYPSKVVNYLRHNPEGGINFEFDLTKIS